MWSAFWVIDSILIVMFAAGFVARWIDPRLFWLPQLMAILLPLTSILLSLIGGWLLLKRKWKQVGIHLIVILLAGSRFFSWESLPAPTAVDNETLRLSSYNLGQLESLTQPELAGKLSEILRLIRPDVLCLQEFLVRYRGDPLRIRNLPSVAAMFDSLNYQVVASEDHSVSHSFKPIFVEKAKVSMISKERMTLSDEASPQLNVLRSVLRWEGKEFAVYNVHLHTFGERKPWLESALNPLNPSYWALFLGQYRDAFLDRAWQADKIHALLEQETLPFILAGDFNSTPHNWAFNRIAEGQKDVFEEAGLKRKMSFHSSFPLVRIDHVLVSKEWDVVGSDILPFAYSDHRPLLVVLRFSE